MDTLISVFTYLLTCKQLQNHKETPQRSGTSWCVSSVSYLCFSFSFVSVFENDSVSVAVSVLCFILPFQFRFSFSSYFINNTNQINSV